MPSIPLPASMFLIVAASHSSLLIIIIMHMTITKEHPSHFSSFAGDYPLGPQENKLKIKTRTITVTNDYVMSGVSHPQLTA